MSKALETSRPLSEKEKIYLSKIFVTNNYSQNNTKGSDMDGLFIVYGDNQNAQKDTINSMFNFLFYEENPSFERSLFYWWTSQEIQEHVRNLAGVHFSEGGKVMKRMGQYPEKEQVLIVEELRTSEELNIIARVLERPRVTAVLNLSVETFEDALIFLATVYPNTGLHEKIIGSLKIETLSDVAENFKSDEIQDREVVS